MHESGEYTGGVAKDAQPPATSGDPFGIKTDFLSRLEHFIHRFSGVKRNG
jgi:hypothetical protein